MKRMHGSDRMRTQTRKCARAHTITQAHTHTHTHARTCTPHTHTHAQRERERERDYHEHASPSLPSPPLPDLMINFTVGKDRHIVELQIAHSKMLTARKGSGRGGASKKRGCTVDFRQIPVRRQ